MKKNTRDEQNGMQWRRWRTLWNWVRWIWPLQKAQTCENGLRSRAARDAVAAGWESAEVKTRIWKAIRHRIRQNHFGRV